jgi:hypothetical protein
MDIFITILHCGTGTGALTSHSGRGPNVVGGGGGECVLEVTGGLVRACLCKGFSPLRVSALVPFLHKVTIKSTFQNLVRACCSSFFLKKK